MRKITKEQEFALKADRLSGMSRKQLCEKYGLTEAGVKSVLARLEVVIPMEQRQANAYSQRLKNNPDAMEHMRKALTPDVMARRSQSIRETYSRPEVRQKASDWMRSVIESRRGKSKYLISDAIVVGESFGMAVFGEAKDFLPESLQVRCHCGRQFSARGFDFLYGKIRSCGCTKSYAQIEIYELVCSWGIEASFNDRTVIPPLELDIWLPQLKIAIEYCGVHFHSDAFKERRDYHLSKKKLCEGKGVRLLTVFSDEWINRKDAVIGFLRSILGYQITRIGARQCSISRVPFAEVKDFVEKNHIQGARLSNVNYALVHEKKIVGVGCFLERNGLELVRWCIAPGLMIVGGFQRLLSAVTGDFPGLDIVTFSDNRWSNGDMYNRNGFVKVVDIPPDYSYVKRGYDFRRYYKSEFRKEKIAQKLGPLLPGETEWAAMKRFGYGRIWDCGKVKWLLPSSLDF